VSEALILPLDLPELEADLSGGLLRRTVHPSGLRVLTEYMPGARSATVGFWVGVGSRDEQAEHEHALERRDIEFGLDGRLDPDVVELQAAGRAKRQRHTNDRGDGSGGHKSP